MQLRATNTTMQVHAASIGNARHHEQRPKAAVNGEGDSGTRDGGGGVQMKATAAVAAQRDGEGGSGRAVLMVPVGAVAMRRRAGGCSWRSRGSREPRDGLGGDSQHPSPELLQNFGVMLILLTLVLDYFPK